MQPPQGPWGNAPPPSPYYPPQGAPGGYPMPGGYPAPGGYGSIDAAVAKLNDEVQSWLIITAVLWFTGLLFVAGPLAWWKAGDFRAKYEALGAAPPSNVGTLRLVGILTTVFALVLMLVIAIGFVAAIALAVRGSVPR